MSIRCLGRRLPPGQPSKQRLTTSLSSPYFPSLFPLKNRITVELFRLRYSNIYESGVKIEGIRTMGHASKQRLVVKICIALMTSKTPLSWVYFCRCRCTCCVFCVRISFLASQFFRCAQFERKGNDYRRLQPITALTSLCLLWPSQIEEICIDTWG